LYLAVKSGPTLYNLLQTLDEYLTSATLGSFAFRLSTLERMSVDLATPAILHITNLYRAFDFDTYYTAAVESVEAKIVEQVRITKFNFSNYHLLKSTVEKSKRQLYAEVSHYRELLHTPITGFLNERRAGYRGNVITDCPVPMPTQQETLADEIVQRLSDLRGDSVTSHVKSLALHELFDRLHANGFSHFY
jgi:hypothetical protein